jgi:hypothetical protein
MRQRRAGPGNVFGQVLEDIANRDVSPRSLLQILGLEETAVVQTESKSNGLSFGNEDDDVLLSKPANREQLEIAKRLARRDCVLVQGPPGTGKTHTIANLLGHLLAQGKRVLVTPHTPKALRVLRQKVVEPLQRLCISVLRNDKQSQEELEASVQKITRLGAFSLQASLLGHPCVVALPGGTNSPGLAEKSAVQGSKFKERQDFLHIEP